MKFEGKEITLEDWKKAVWVVLMIPIWIPLAIISLPVFLYLHIRGQLEW